MLNLFIQSCHVLSLYANKNDSPNFFCREEVMFHTHLLCMRT